MQDLGEKPICQKREAFANKEGFTRLNAPAQIAVNCCGGKAK
jgi:hypothetical protein